MALVAAAIEAEAPARDARAAAERLTALVDGLSTAGSPARSTASARASCSTPRSTGAAMTLEFGVFITPSSATPEAVVELAVLADQVGLDLVTFQDHPYQPKLLDAWTLLVLRRRHARRASGSRRTC